MKNMVQAYAAVDRIPSLHLKDDQPSPQALKDLDIGILFPTQSEIEELRYNCMARVLILYSNIYFVIKTFC